MIGRRLQRVTGCWGCHWCWAAVRDTLQAFLQQIGSLLREQLITVVERVQLNRFQSLEFEFVFEI